MIHLSTLLLLFSSLCYGTAFLFHLFSLSGHGSERASVSLRLGFLIATVYFAAEALEHGFFLPVINFSQALAFFSWSLAFVYLVLLTSVRGESFSLVLSPILFLLTAFAFGTRINDREALQVPQVLLNPYFMAHIAAAFFAYANFAISFAAGLLYLLQYRELKAKRAGAFYHRLPSLEELERFISRPLFWGAPMLAAAVVIGMFWSKAAFGHFWLSDPKTLATLLTMIVYFLILLLHSVSSVRGKRMAVFSLMAFGILLCSFIGPRFIETSHHFVK